MERLKMCCIKASGTVFHCSTVFLLPMYDQPSEPSKVLPLSADSFSGYSRQGCDHALHDLIPDWIVSVEQAIFSIGFAKIFTEHIAAPPRFTPVVEKGMNGTLCLGIGIQKMPGIGRHSELIIPPV